MSADSYKNAGAAVLQRVGRFRAAALGLVSLLLGAVIFAQTLGLMHQLAHSPQMHGAAAAERHHHAGKESSAHTQAWLETLFASHEDGSNSCRVFDQHGHTAPMTALAALALPSVLRSVFATEGITCSLAAAAASFEARAPPFSR